MTVVGTDGIATRRRLCADSCGTLEAPSFRLSWGRAGLALSPGPARVPDAPALLRGHTCTADSHGHSGSSEAISDSESVFHLAGACTVTAGRSLESTLKVASCGAPFERRGWAAHGRPASVLADACKPPGPPDALCTAPDGPLETGLNFNGPQATSPAPSGGNSELRPRAATRILSDLRPGR